MRYAILALLCGCMNPTDPYCLEVNRQLAKDFHEMRRQMDAGVVQFRVALDVEVGIKAVGRCLDDRIPNGF